jgi:hypothetical protein
MSDECKPSDRVACAANYRSIVDGTYQDYRAVTSETANLQTHTVHLRGAVDANSGGNCSLTVDENAEMRQARLVHYRALVEVEYREVRPSQNMDLPALVEASENSENKFLHADADPLRAFGPASETHPAELEAAMARLDGAGAEDTSVPDCDFAGPIRVTPGPRQSGSCGARNSRAPRSRVVSCAWVLVLSSRTSRAATPTSLPPWRAAARRAVRMTSSDPSSSASSILRDRGCNNPADRSRRPSCPAGATLTAAWAQDNGVSAPIQGGPTDRKQCTRWIRPQARDVCRTSTCW